MSGGSGGAAASGGGGAAAAAGGNNPEADAKYQQYLRDVSNATPKRTTTSASSVKKAPMHVHTGKHNLCLNAAMHSSSRQLLAAVVSVAGGVFLFLVLYTSTPLCDIAYTTTRSRFC